MTDENGGKMADEDGQGTTVATQWSWPSRHDEASVIVDDDDERRWLAERRRPEKLTEIRDWLAAVFTRSVKVGERLLEDGHVAEAAVAFAHATLLTDRAGTFATAVRRVYPSYFYRLFERRMTAMGYGHLFVERSAARSPRRRSPADGTAESGRRDSIAGSDDGDGEPSSSDHDDP